MVVSWRWGKRSDNKHTLGQSPGAFAGRERNQGRLQKVLSQSNEQNAVGTSCDRGKRRGDLLWRGDLGDDIKGSVLDKSGLRSY